MSQGAAGLLLFVVLCLGCAVVAHALLRRFALAVLASTAASVALFQVAAYLDLGYLDPSWIVGVVTTGVIASMASGPIGVLVRRIRAGRESGRLPPESPIASPPP